VSLLTASYGILGDWAMKTLNLILCAFFLLTFAGNVHGASFDCGKATSEAAKLICGNEELSRLDESLKRRAGYPVLFGSNFPIFWAPDQVRGDAQSVHDYE
jgi:hypothetical protein